MTGIGRTAMRELSLSAEERQLVRAGITANELWEKWGVILWSIRSKSGRVKIKLEAHRMLNICELEHHLEKILHQPVYISQRSVSECCHSDCKGCLWNDPTKRAFWNPLVQMPGVQHESLSC
jgi:hypothetical protein